jgi:hypothetical protein
VQTTNPLRSYLQRSEQHSAHIWCKPKTLFEGRYKDQNNAVHTSIYHLQIAPTNYYYYYYYSIVENARMHNVTMRIVANGFGDEPLHIAFGETLLATLTRDEWVLTSCCQERRNAS